MTVRIMTKMQIPKQQASKRGMACSLEDEDNLLSAAVHLLKIVNHYSSGNDIRNSKNV